LCGWGPKKNGGQAEQALGRSRGGFSSKIHIGVDGLGNPLRFLLTAGQAHDSTQAKALIAGLDFERLIADKSYDFDELLDLLRQQEAEAVIPPRANRKQQREYDQHLYKERHLVECFINKIKQYRRIFTRFDKLASRFLGFLQFVGTLIWLR
jgi:transposase